MDAKDYLYIAFGVVCIALILLAEAWRHSSERWRKNYEAAVALFEEEHLNVLGKQRVINVLEGLVARDRGTTSEELRAAVYKDRHENATKNIADLEDYLRKFARKHGEDYGALSIQCITGWTYERSRDETKRLLEESSDNNANLGKE